MKSLEIRKRFFDYFINHGHTKVPSSSLIPAQDPTLLFTNAGMNQFKDVFLGLEKRSYNRAVSIQKCLRAGGKHNDLDNVGFTKRHLTFFEMMGNFSFGDYFKHDAIKFAWDFLTKELNLPAEKLHPSVFTTDDESYDIWHKEIDIPKERIHRLGEADNFWSMGDLGPCGPCSEIYIDRGTKFGCGAETCAPGCDCDRFLEIWNLVFMQYDRQADGTLKPLKQTGVDTGMGFERIASVVQNKDSVYEIDSFQEIIAAIEKLSGKKYAGQSPQITAAFHVLADHIRAATFLIADGCAPANDGRGYVLRKIIRRAALFAQKLTPNNIFPDLAKTVIQTMGDIYPELYEHQELIIKLLKSEIEKFSVNLVRGNLILEEYFDEQSTTKKLTGEQVFKLYDTYGFPLELVIAAARERNYTVEVTEFEKLMAQQQAQSGKKLTDPLDHVDMPESIASEFTGYQELSTPSKIIALVTSDGKLVDNAKTGQTIFVIAEKSPFFIVGGGQVPDQGWLAFNGTKVPLKSVRFVSGRIAPQIKTPIDIKIGDVVTGHVDETWRTNAMKNHTATHLLQSALISLFGKHIQQAGSLVHPDYLRFDFTYHDNLTKEDIKKVEDLVNEKIREDIPVAIEYTTLKNALDHGALAFFGDKYNPEDVRMVKVDEFSTELCGGTHVPRTGAIGTFKITDISALSAGQRRIIAITGPRAIELFQDVFNTVKTLSQEFKVKREIVYETVLKQKEQLKEMQQELKAIKTQLVKSKLGEWEQEIQEINGVPTLILSLKDYHHDEIKDIMQNLSHKCPGFYFITSTTDAKSLFAAQLSTQYKDKIDLKDFGAWLKSELGLRGGGNAHALQGGGGIIDPRIKEKIHAWLNN